MESPAGEVKALVIDNGSYLMKVGFGDEDQPKETLPCQVFRPRHRGVVKGMGGKGSFVGFEATSKHFLNGNLACPMEGGYITGWDDMEKVLGQVWHYCFYDSLRVDPQEKPVLLTESPLNPKRYREKMTNIMFEEHSTPAIYMANQAVLALYATGRTTGTVLHLGEGAATAVSIYEGYEIAHATMRVELGGQDLTDFLSKLLIEKGEKIPGFEEFPTWYGPDIVRDIKEKHCYVAQDFDSELELASKSQSLENLYRKPDSDLSVSIGSERFRCPEALFNPSLFERSFEGIHEAVFHSIMKCDSDIREDLFGTIVLAGGTTTLPGFTERLQKELEKLAGDEYKVKVIATPNRTYSSWLGGSYYFFESIVASSPPYQLLKACTPLWITKEEYEETGPVIVHRKCF